MNTESPAAMDLSLLSAETYYDGALDVSNLPTELHHGGNQPARPLQSSSSQPRKLTKQRESPPNMKARQPFKRESSKTANVDDSSGARQRGRPRLDTRDQTAAEVYASNSSKRHGSKADQTAGYSVAVRRYGWLNEPIDSERRPPYPH